VIYRNGKIARKFVGFSRDSPEMLPYFDSSWADLSLLLELYLAVILRRAGSGRERISGKILN